MLWCVTKSGFQVLKVDTLCIGKSKLLKIVLQVKFLGCNWVILHQFVDQPLLLLSRDENCAGYLM
jgi:hypothetical protein